VAVRPEAIEMRRWRSNDALARTGLGATCETMFGAPYYTLHRADLHLALRELVGRRLMLGRRCVGLAETEGDVWIRFADGSQATADLVVGADGIRSTVRTALAPDLPKWTGMTVYRGLIRSSRLPHRHIRPEVVIWLGPGQHCVSYPVPGWLSFVATAPAGCSRAESWTARAGVAEVVRAYTGWHDEVRRMLGAADSVTRWALHERDALPRWSTRRVTLLGDAAHAMLPFGAQGASQAVEDAAALATCLDGVATEQVPRALGRYERARRPRVERVAATVRGHARDHHLPDGEEQRWRDQTLTEFRLKQQEWLYGYDAEAAVRR
jgi:salicylate hydroxylase